MPFFAFDTYNLLSVFLLIAGIQFALFIFAASFRTDKLTDLAYGSTFALVALVLVLKAEAHVRTWIVAGAIILWGLRLSGYLFLRIIKMGKDSRFDGRRESVLSFASFWSLQTVAIWIILLPFIFLSGVSAQQEFGLLDISGLVLFLTGFLIEAISDQQKFRFRNNPDNKDRWIESGLWKYSRYPNYFGEIVLWSGLWIASIGGLDSWMLLSVISPIFITLLLLKVSGIPLLEKAQQAKYGSNRAFQEYCRRTPMLIPGPQKAKPL